MDRRRPEAPFPVWFVVVWLCFRRGCCCSCLWNQNDQTPAPERLPDRAADGGGEGDPGCGGGHGDRVPRRDRENPAGEREPAETAAGHPAPGGRDRVAE